MVREGLLKVVTKRKSNKQATGAFALRWIEYLRRREKQMQRPEQEEFCQDKGPVLAVIKGTSGKRLKRQSSKIMDGFTSQGED